MTPQLTEPQYEFEIVTLPKIRLASVPHRGDYQQIDHAFQRLGELAGPAGLNGGARMFGLYYDDPASVATSELRAAACISVESTAKLPDGLAEAELVGGRYARVLHQGAYAELPRAYEALYRTWLPQSGATPRNAPCAEEYLNTPREVRTEDLRTYVLLPVEG